MASVGGSHTEDVCNRCFTSLCWMGNRGRQNAFHLCDLSNAVYSNATVVPASVVLIANCLALDITPCHHLVLLNLLPVGHAVRQEDVNNSQILCGDDEIVLICDASFVMPASCSQKTSM